MLSLSKNNRNFLKIMSIVNFCVVFVIRTLVYYGLGMGHIWPGLQFLIKM